MNEVLLKNPEPLETKYRESATSPLTGCKPGAWRCGQQRINTAANIGQQSDKQRHHQCRAANTGCRMPCIFNAPSTSRALPPTRPRLLPCGGGGGWRVRKALFFLAVEHGVFRLFDENSEKPPQGLNVSSLL